MLSMMAVQGHGFDLSVGSLYDQYDLNFSPSSVLQRFCRRFRFKFRNSHYRFLENCRECLQCYIMHPTKTAVIKQKALCNSS